VYAWIGGDDPRDVSEAASAQIAAGFRAVKVNACAQMDPLDSPARIADVVDGVASVKQAIGDSLQRLGYKVTLEPTGEAA
jgi:galactonate dehydratase